MKDYSLKRVYRWYTVYTKSRAEKKLYAELTKKGIECYLPLKAEKRQLCDRVKVVEEPLIRGYVFVKVSYKEYYDVLMANGAIRYVCFDGKPAIIPECQIEDLKIFMRYENSDIEVTSERIKKGDYIKVVCGPLKDVCGEVVEIRGKQRILLRFSSLGYCIHAEFRLNTIELIRKNENSFIAG